jgi:hypothetical protein
MTSTHDTMKSTTATGARSDRILVVGTARSGTSWLAKALGHAANTRHLPEPDNIDTEHEGKAPGYLGIGAYPILDPGDAPSSLTSLWDFVFQGRVPANRKVQLAVGRRFVRLPRQVRDPMFRMATATLKRMPGGPSHRVVKSIFIMFSLEWIMDRYRPQVVLIQRNPLNVVSSWVQLNIPSFDLATRPAIRERYLDRLGIAPPPDDAVPLQRAAWSVGLLTSVIAEAHTRHPEWPLYTHEDLCIDSATKIQEVYRRVGLTWDAGSAAYLAESNRPGEGLRPVRVTSEQPERWKQRLTEEQAAMIQDTLAQFPTRGWIRAPEGG